LASGLAVLLLAHSLRITLIGGGDNMGVLAVIAGILLVPLAILFDLAKKYK
jgi:hypothetical protein